MDEERQNEFKQGPHSSLPFGGGELVRTAGRIIKVKSIASTRIFVLDPHPDTGERVVWAVRSS